MFQIETTFSNAAVTDDNEQPIAIESNVKTTHEVQSPGTQSGSKEMMILKALGSLLQELVLLNFNFVKVA